jgi:4-hydroxy 2-oxovalerate aldolase
MSNIKVLDCTLRDGGYCNDWKFGDAGAQNIVRQLGTTGVDYVEVGFIKLCEYIKDKIQFSEMSQIARLFRSSNQKLSLIVEAGYGYPVTSFPEHSENTVDLVRVVMWKRMLDKGYDYCKALMDKGYQVSVQATRTEQYSDEEFKSLCDKFSTINPTAVYIVDTFGVFDAEEVMKYATIADEHLGDGILMGYHAHNNMQQAFANVKEYLEHPWKHDVMVDGSVMGMGKVPGNLCLELILKYLNEHHGCSYDYEACFDIYEKYLDKVFKVNPWGYSMPYLLSARNRCNPSYVQYMQKKGVPLTQMATIYRLMRERDVGITFDTGMCDQLIEEVTSKTKVV